MPKNYKTEKVGNNVLKRNKVASKMRIGTRKTGISGYLMTTTNLMDIITNSDRKRDHDNARKVLTSRGVSVS